MWVCTYMCMHVCVCMCVANQSREHKTDHSVTAHFPAHYQQQGLMGAHNEGPCLGQVKGEHSPNSYIYPLLHCLPLFLLPLPPITFSCFLYMLLYYPEACDPVCTPSLLPLFTAFHLPPLPLSPLFFPQQSFSLSFLWLLLLTISRMLSFLCSPGVLTQTTCITAAGRGHTQMHTRTHWHTHCAAHWILNMLL